MQRLGDQCRTMITAIEIQEGLVISVALSGGDDRADDDPVSSALVHGVNAAVEPCQSVTQDGRPRFDSDEIGNGEALFVVVKTRASSEVIGDRHLIGTQERNSKMTSTFDQGDSRGILR